MKLFQDATLRLTPGQALNSEGLMLFRLALWVGGQEVDHLTAVSGQPTNQALLTCTARAAGCQAPIGEGVYRLGDADAVRRVNWASGRPGDFSGSFPVRGDGLGPIWIGIHPTPEYPCDTTDYGIHPDWNESGSPGTLGCTGIQGETGPRDLGRLKRLVSWFDHNDIANYVVDHGRGTVPRPK